MSTFKVTATKPSMKTKVGLVFFAGNNDTIVLDDIKEYSIFQGSNLKIGQEIISINGTKVQGMGVSAVKTLLEYADGQVVIEQPGVLVQEEEEETAQQSVVPTVVGQVYHLTWSFDGSLINNPQREELPNIFKRKQIPLAVWQSVLDSAMEIAHSMKSFTQSEERYKHFMEQHYFVNRQMVTGVGFGTESRDEKKAYTLTHDTAFAHSNLSMVASSVVAKASGMMSYYGITAQLIFRSQGAAKLPMGLRFTVFA
ncbi:expressed unknown protein [Seminavis robusta]|uniref:PDZ domain-containing protein n=1 Tax=Seminavis robusta TaxID=568900 RepID=A0A9N8EPD1_9STRA|nr:expressed unknown protein [Seminavis robusta]|eukprot:Sro1334_g263800.1 n/a (254) ;mRNA; f:14234-14995